MAFHVDRTFNLVDYLQSQDRIHRISQTRYCEIILLIVESTVDVLVDFVLELKHRVAQHTQSDATHLAADDAMMLRPGELRELVGAL